MSVGLYGKVPGRRDFVNHQVPLGLLEEWDSWVLRCLEAWRASIPGGKDWEELYLGAPIWRFRLPPGPLGPLSVAGVLCPSMDAVGRCYPLAVLAFERPNADMRSSSQTPVSEWFGACETLCLDALEPDRQWDDITQAADQVGDPDWLALGLAENERVGLWETIGGPERPALALRCGAGLPAPSESLTLIDQIHDRPGWERIDVQ